MEKITCIVVDDEQLAREGIAEYITRLDFLELKGTFSSAVEAGNFLNKNECDLVFLDIEMPGMSGISFVQTLVKSPLVVFITAYPGYALTGFELNALDYLVKPVSFERFVKTVNKGMERLQNKSAETHSVSGDFIFIRTENKFLKINYDEIDFIEGMKDYVKIHCGQNRHMALANLKTIGSALPESIFMRVHKSFIVNLNKVKSVENHQLISGTSEVPVGKEFKDHLYEVLIKRKLIQR